MTTAVQLAQSVAPGVSLGFKNRIINGAMMIDQRNAGASVTPTDGQYTLDRWDARLSQASKYTVQQSTTVPAGYKNSLVVTSSSAYTVGASEFFAICQPIEGYNVADLGWGAAGAQPVTLSFWVRSSLTGTFGGSMRNNNSDRSYPFTYTISSANTWEQKSITVAGDTSGTWATGTTIGLNVIFGLGCGSSASGTAGSWAGANYWSATGATSVVGTNGATFYITGVQLEVGTAATSFEFRDYGRELIMCQRYYEIVGVAASGDIVIGGYSNGSTPAYFSYSFAVVKRAAPTVTKNGTWATGSGAGQPGPAETSTWGFRAYVTGSTANANFYAQNAGSGQNFTASAEL